MRASQDASAAPRSASLAQQLSSGPKLDVPAPEHESGRRGPKQLVAFVVHNAQLYRWDAANGRLLVSDLRENAFKFEVRSWRPFDLCSPSTHDAAHSTQDTAHSTRYSTHDNAHRHYARPAHVSCVQKAREVKPAVDFDVHWVVPNETGSYIALAGVHRCFVLRLREEVCIAPSHACVEAEHSCCHREASSITGPRQ
jgi:hypothetical protein